MKYTKFIDDLHEYNNQNKYSSNHEFSSSTNNSEDKAIQVICEFLCQRGDILSEGHLRNLVTGEILDTPTKEFLLNCVDRSDKLIKEFRNNRIVLKNKMLIDKITKELIKKDSNQYQPAKDLKKESMILLRSVDVARIRCYDIKTFTIGSHKYFFLFNQKWISSFCKQ